MNHKKSNKLVCNKNWINVKKSQSNSFLLKGLITNKRKIMEKESDSIHLCTPLPSAKSQIWTIDIHVQIRVMLCAAKNSQI